MDLPRRFYKFRSINERTKKHVRATIVDHKIKYSGAIDFNDPFELYPRFSFESTSEHRRKDHEEIADRIGLTDPVRRLEFFSAAEAVDRDENRSKMEEAIKEAHHERLSREIGIYCVTTDFSNILMWSHYADSHRGICLEFNGEADYMAVAQKVEYVEKRSVIKYFLRDDEAGMTAALLTKSTAWKYEDEWRLLAHPGSEGMDAPGIDVIPENLLTGIIFGIFISDHWAKVISEWNRKRRVPAKLYRAAMAPDGFDFVINPI